jgi:uncharacterized coiled-coil protein SlyX
MHPNEVQKQQQRIDAQDQRAAAQDAVISELKPQLGEIRSALIARPNKDQLIAQR